MVVGEAVGKGKRWCQYLFIVAVQLYAEATEKDFESPATRFSWTY